MEKAKVEKIKLHRTSIIKLDEFKKLIEMLNSTDEDANIAIENIRNLEIDELTLKLILACCRYNSKYGVIKAAGRQPWNYRDVKTSELYRECNKSTEIHKEIFHYLISEMIGEVFSDYDFININTNIRWT